MLQAAIDDPTYELDNWNSDSRLRDFYNPPKLRRDVGALAEYQKLPAVNRFIEGIEDAGSHASFALKAIGRALEDTSSWVETPPPTTG